MVPPTRVVLRLSRRLPVTFASQTVGVLLFIGCGSASIVASAAADIPGHPLKVRIRRDESFRLEVRFPSAPGKRAIVDETTNSLLGNIQPSDVARHTITVYKNGRVTFGSPSPPASPRLPPVPSPRPRGHFDPGPGVLTPGPNARFARSPATFPRYEGRTLPFAWGDLDGDGDQDLNFSRNDGGGVFSKIPSIWSILDLGSYHGVSICDYDRDGDLDIVTLPYSWVPSRVLLLRNNGQLNFTNVAPEQGMDLEGYGESAVWGDFDGDSWPDLFTPYYSHLPPHQSFFYRNNRNGTFSDISDSAGVALRGLPADLKPEGADAVDWDDDGDLDLYVASHLFRNDGTAHFTDILSEVGIQPAFDEGAGFIDYDNDGDFDLYRRTQHGRQLLRNDAGHFTDVSEESGLGPATFFWGDSWADVDNDGDLDLLTYENDGHGRLFLNRGNGTFAEDSAFAAFGLFGGGSAWADYDGDGDLDVIDGQPYELIDNLLDLEPGVEDSYLRVVVVDEDGRHTQHGATVRLERNYGRGAMTRAVGGGWTYLSRNELPVHFGLGVAGTVARSPDLGEYPPGATVVLTAVPSPGYHLAGWTGDASGDANPLTVTVNDAMDFSATFAPDLQALSVTTLGSGVVTRNPDLALYPKGSAVTLTAVPAPGQVFLGWSGDTTGTANPITLTMAGNRSVTARFTCRLQIQLVGAGTVSKNPDQPNYAPGTLVQLTATAGPGHRFAGWSGDTSSTVSPLTIVMNADRTIVASFVANPEMLWVGTSAGGDGVSWSNGANWSAGRPPGFSDNVRLDHASVTGDYTVQLPSGSASVVIGRLVLDPATDKRISLVLPPSNTANPGLKMGDGIVGDPDLLLRPCAELRNLSGASSGNGIQVSTSADRVRIENGARYLHATARSAAGLAPFLTTDPGTAQGQFEFDVPGGSAFNLPGGSVSYGSLVLTRTGGPASYAAAGSATLAVRGNLKINPGVTLYSSMSGPLLLGGHLTNNGRNLTLTQPVVFGGDSVQVLSGSAPIQLGGTAVVDSAATLALEAPLQLVRTMTIRGALRIRSDGLVVGNGTVVYDPVLGTLVLNNTASLQVKDNSYWPASMGPPRVTVQGPGGIMMNVDRAVSRIFRVAAPVARSDRLTLGGLVRLEPGGALTDPPRYGAEATLEYATGMTVGNEWRTGDVPGVGVPKHVRVDAGAGTVALAPGDRTVPGDLVVASGTLARDASAGSLRLFGSLDVAGTLGASGRAIAFMGSAAQTISGAGPMNLGPVHLAKSGGVVRLARDLRAIGAAGGPALILEGTSDSLDLGGHGLTLEGALGGSNAAAAFRGGNGSSLSIAGTGDLGMLRFAPGTERLAKLSVDAAGGGSLTLATSLTVEDSLGLRRGRLVTGAETLVVANGAVTARDSGHVEGTLRKWLSPGAPATSFEIGSAGRFAPIDVDLGALTTGGSLTAATFAGDHPGIGDVLVQDRTVNRWWRVENQGLVFDSARVALHFAASELDSGADLSTFRVVRHEDSTWSVATPGPRGPERIEGSGLAGFGELAAGSLRTYALQVSAGDSGRVTRSPDQALYEHGSLVTLTAAPVVGYHLLAWSGDASGSQNPLVVVVDREKTISATFEIDSYALFAIARGPGSVRRDPDQSSYRYGSVVTLTALPDSGRLFMGWTGDAQGIETPTVVTMDGEKTVTAMFSLHLTASATAGGWTTRSPEETHYAPGTSVQLTAWADSAYQFVGWSGDTSGTENPMSLVLERDRWVNAVFERKPHALAVAIVGKGRVTRNPELPAYPPGTAATLSAEPARGYRFEGWSGSLSGTQNPVTIVMDGPKSVTATFVDRDPPGVQVMAPNGGQAFQIGNDVDFRWNASDSAGVATVDLYLLHHGTEAPIEAIALGQENDGVFAWKATEPVTSRALLVVVARDSSSNAAADTSDRSFAILNSLLSAGDAAPRESGLESMRPNPARAGTQIVYAVGTPGRARVSVLDVQGREVAVLADHVHAPGLYTVAWTGRGRAGGILPGLYFVRYETGGRRWIQRLVVLGES